MVVNNLFALITRSSQTSNPDHRTVFWTLFFALDFRTLAREERIPTAIPFCPTTNSTFYIILITDSWPSYFYRPTTPDQGEDEDDEENDETMDGRTDGRYSH